MTPLKSHIQTTEAIICKQGLKLAISLTLLAESTGDWGSSGVDFGRQSAMRWLCDLPPTAPLPSIDVYMTALRNVAIAHELLPDVSTDNWLETIDVRTLRTTIDNFQFVIDDHSFGIKEGESVDNLLAQSGSDLVVVSGYHGQEITLILGRGKRTYRPPYTHITLTNEICRSPSIVMPIVAMIGIHHIVIREEAIATVFEDKWMRLSDSDWGSVAYKLGHHIKKSAMHYYGLTHLNRDKIRNIYPTFLADMTPMLSAHEVGHGIIQHDILPENIAIVAEHSQIFGESILTALLELLADIAPETAYGKGPLLLLTEMDNKIAKRCFCIYLSDAYFYDTETPHMFGYSHIVLPVMVRLWQLHLSPEARPALASLAEWALSWVTTLTTALQQWMGQPPEVTVTEPFARYLEKSRLYHSNIQSLLTPQITEKALHYLKIQAPIIRQELYTQLGYQISEKQLIPDIIKLINSLDMTC